MPRVGGVRYEAIQGMHVGGLMVMLVLENCEKSSPDRLVGPVTAGAGFVERRAASPKRVLPH